MLAKLAKIAKKSIDEAKFLMSNSFRARTERYLRSITGNYKNLLKFIPGKVATDGNLVMADPLSPMIEDLDLPKKIAAVRGQVAHEAFHILYTDFSSVRKWAKEIQNAQPFERFRILMRKDFLNIVEDSAIELAGCTDFPGLAPYIRLLNETAFRKLPAPQEIWDRGQKLKAFQMQCAAYAIIGKTKKIKDPELKALMQKAIPHLDAGRVARTTKDRQKESDALFEIAKDLIEEAFNQGQQEEFQNPKGNDMTEQGEGQGQPMPQQTQDWRQKPQKQKQQEEEQKETSKEDTQGSGSAGKEEEKEEKAQKGSDSGSSKYDEEEDEKENEGESDGSASGDKKNDEGSEEGGVSNSEAFDDSDDSNDNSEPNSSNQDADDPASEDDGDLEGESDEEEFDQDYLEELEEELQKEIDQVALEMEKETEAQNQSEKRMERVKDHLRNKVNYSNAHASIKVVSHFDYIIPRDSQINYVKRVEEELKSVTRGLTRRLQNMIRYNMEERRTGMTSGSLTQSQLWRKDARIFSQKKDKNDEADLAVLVLIDESGSMESYNRSDYARYATIMLANVCDSLKIPFAAMGHHAIYGRKVVEHFHYITFEKPVKAQIANLANIDARHNTREGVSLKYAGEYIGLQPEKDKIIIVISDGEPMHYSGNGQHFYGVPARTDAALIVEELARKGITTVGVAIGEGEDYIAEIYKNYISIPNLEKLPTKLVEILQKRIFKD